MTTQRYSLQSFDEKTMVRVIGKNMPFSHKAGYEIANFIKGRKVSWALKALEGVMEKKVAVPYKRYNFDVAHKPGKIAAARYPYKASIFVIQLLKNLQGAARNKGLDMQNLTVVHAAVQKGPRRRRSGGFVRKNSHFELAAKEVIVVKKEKKKVAKVNVSETP